MIRWHRTRDVPLGQAGLCVRSEALAELGRRLLLRSDLQRVRTLAWAVTTVHVPEQSRFNRMPSYGRGFWLNAEGSKVTEVLGHGSQSNYWYFDLRTDPPRGFVRLHLSGPEAGGSLWEWGSDWDESASNIPELHHASAE